MLIGLAIVVGLAGAGIYAGQQGHIGVFAMALLYALAALAAGGLFGFLFGLPHAGNGAAKSAQKAGLVAADADVSTVVGPSTNLQQIADWLTKLIIGASLTQIGRLPSAASSLFNAMAPGLGGSTSAAAFAGAIVVYFALLGFVSAWLITYFYLTPAMVRMDRSIGSLLEQSGRLAAQAGRAAMKGKTEEAEKLNAASEAQASRATALLTKYAALYRVPKRDPARIPDLDTAIDQVAAEELAKNPSAQDVQALYDDGTQRQREVALAIMARDPSRASVDSVLSGISRSGSGMEQYQALRAADGLASSLTADDASRLEAAIREQMTGTGHVRPGTDRRRIAERVLARLQARAR